MRTRFTRSAIVLLAAAAALSTAGAQSPAHAPVPMAVSQQAVPNTLSTFTGTFIFNFVITLKPTIPTNYPITCSATLMPLDVSAGVTYDVKSVTAVRSGNTATCNFSINYAWNLSSGSTMVNTSYTVTSAGTTTSLIDRTSAGSLPSVTVPANGTSLTRAVDVTL